MINYKWCPQFQSTQSLAAHQRSHLELDVYAAMDVHTENTIKEGQSIMQVFGERMQVCSFNKLIIRASHCTVYGVWDV